MSIKTMDWKGSPIYVGIHKAIVIDNKDPDLKGRVRILSPVIGETGWIPCTVIDDGAFNPPDISTVVYVQFDGCNINYPIVIGVSNDGRVENPDTPLIFRREVPTNRGLVTSGELQNTGKPVVTNGGHSIEFDDGLATVDEEGLLIHTSESRGVRITSSQGHSLKLSEEGDSGNQENRIELSTVGGQQAQFIDDNDAENQKIVIKDAEDRTIEIIKETDRVRIRNSSGTIYIDIDFANDVIEIDANNVKLGTNAAESIVRGDAFKSFFESHTHPAPGGPSGVPFQTMTPGIELSNKHKVE